MPSTPFGRRPAPPRRRRLMPLALGGAVLAAVASGVTQREAVARLLGRLSGGSDASTPAAGASATATGTPTLTAGADAPALLAGVPAAMDAPGTTDFSSSDPAEPGVDFDRLALAVEGDPAFDLDSLGLEPPTDTPREGIAAPANYDLEGPAENTATALPVAPSLLPDSLDEEAEIAAAAAEAAAIGGMSTPYAASDLEGYADEAERPLAEAGGGVAEGLEQADAELVDAAAPYDGMSPYERQIEDAIAAQADPLSGESAEALESTQSPIDELDARGDDDPGNRVG